MSDSDIQNALDDLMRGLSVGPEQTAAESYKTLYKLGAKAIPLIEQTILASKWDDIEYPHQMKLVGSLVGLIHDIDETKSRAIAEILTERGCHTSVTHLLNAICRSSLYDYHRYEINGIQIFESKEIVTAYDIKEELTKWLNNIPPDDLHEIERIYVVKKKEYQDYAGYYVTRLFVITIVWYSLPRIWKPLNRILMFPVEHTLYHEIGHHIHRHTEGWRDPEKENQADRYAGKILRKSWPRLTVVFRAVGKVVRLVFARLMQHMIKKRSS